MSIILKGKIGSKERSDGGRPPFLSLPKPDYYDIISGKSSEDEMGLIQWYATWEGDDICHRVLSSSQRKVGYWKKIIVLYKTMKKEYPQLEHIDYLIVAGKQEIKMWRKTTKAIEKQINS